MRKIILIITISLLSIFINYAKDVTIKKAKSVAVNYITYVNKEFNSTIINEFTINYKNYDVIYVFNFKDGGYILISTDDEVYPILSYSFEGKFVKNDPNMPPAYSRWIQWYEDQIIIAKNTSIKPFARTIEAWRKYSNQITNKNLMTVDALLDIDDIKWDQGCYYNEDCPEDGDGACGHVFVGCVATAMAQIMRYHKYPSSGYGSHSYSSDYGTLSANFGNTQYNWSSMPGHISSANSEIAKISYHVGVAVEMQYGAGGSGAYDHDVRDAMVNYFRYSTDATYAKRSNYNTSDWKDLIKSSLDNQWPVYYAGNDGGNVGHAFVCDGYNSNDKFHFNWGWSGNYNSWNTLDNIVPGSTGAGGGSGNYSYGNKMVYNIHP